ncbi:MAG: GNAT family N-acetyltransferase [Promethearchaeota archaeon]
MIEGLSDPNWKQKYSNKLTTAEGVLSNTLKRGNRVFVQSGCGNPSKLVKTLVNYAHQLSDIEIVHFLTLGEAPYTESKLGNVFRTNAFVIGENVRKAINEGRGDYTPVFQREIEQLFKEGIIPIDVALVTVSPPDRYGYCSLGISVDISKAAAENTKTLIAEINPQMPYTFGASFIHVNEIEYMVINNVPLLEAIPPPPSETAHKIGQNVARLVENGSTIQGGMGQVPNAVLRYLSEKEDLGVHTQLFSDAILELIRMGVVTNMKKSIHRGKNIASFCAGSQRLYDFVDSNPTCEFYPAIYVSDPFVIAQNKKMCAINGALEVDLTGQACAESIGTYLYSGIGSHADFMRGARRSKGGKPIIALPSTAKNGTISRIVPYLSPGAGVVTTRGDIRFVVTEYGIASLYGKSIRERALALISIAHPKFREELLEKAKEFHYVHPDQLPPLATGVFYPDKLEIISNIFDPPIHFRPIKPTDQEMLKALLYSSSDETVRQRFFSMVQAWPHEKLQGLCNIDYEEEMAIVGLIGDPLAPDTEDMIAIGQYYLDRSKNMAEVAFLVRDDYQGHGIGTFLLQYLMRIAKVRGIKGFMAEVMKESKPMISVFYKVAKEIRSQRDFDTITISFPL